MDPVRETAVPSDRMEGDAGLLAGATALLVLGVADAALADRFTGYGKLRCGTFDRDKICSVGDLPSGVFIARKQNRVRYTFCVRKPSSKSCDRKGRRPRASRPRSDSPSSAQGSTA